MSRAKWKGPYVQKSLLSQFSNKKSNSKNEITTYSRKSVIIPLFVGSTVNIHNGKTFSKIKITENMIGHKLGEFSPTRKRFSFKKKKKK
uniref:ribosomal protein S19 n=1 Tax=Hemiaulus sinensis TaxID=1003062 RepID=UPI002029381B|nr:ribosomal protein S19 [Hemiaulus sinensis]QYB23183.1 ribosomal protein S19 [Hemiaulus sinensis]